MVGEKRYSPENINLEKKSLKTLIRKIVEVSKKNSQKGGSDGLSSKKTKPVADQKHVCFPNINSLTKDELIALSKKNKLTVSSTNTKAEILKKLKENKVKVL